MVLSRLIPCSNRSECKNGFPLQIYLSGDLEQSTKTLDIEFSPEQIRQIIRKVDWDVLVKCASQFGMSLPLSYSEEDLDDDIFLCAVHDAVLKFQIMEAELVCPSCNHRYLVSKGIPNMISDNLVSGDSVTD